MVEKLSTLKGEYTDVYALRDSVNGLIAVINSLTEVAEALTERVELLELVIAGSGLRRIGGETVELE